MTKDEKTTIERIQENAVYQQILKDSCGGVMYDESKRGTYEGGEILALWDSLDPSEQSAAGGIMRGAVSFLQGE